MASSAYCSVLLSVTIYFQFQVPRLLLREDPCRVSGGAGDMPEETEQEVCIQLF
jgi:hypothetical protein